MYIYGLIKDIVMLQVATIYIEFHQQKIN